MDKHDFLTETGPSRAKQKVACNSALEISYMRFTVIMGLFRTGNKTQKVIYNCTVNSELLFKLISTFIIMQEN